MSRHNELLAFYGQVLHGLNCNVTEDSLVQMVTSNQTIPVTLENDSLRLVLPTQEALNKLAEGNLVAFHPMCENIILGQSPVINVLRSLTIESLSLKIMATIIGITMAIADKTELSATQIKFAADFDKVDEKTVKALVKLADAIDPTTENRLINVYLKHGGMIGDEQFKRIATVTFPLYGALLEATDTVYGVKMRKQDVRMLILMLEKLFPNIGERDTYSFGSNSLVCPYFHAILNAFGNVVGQLNKRTFIFRKIIEDYTGETPHVNIDYIENFADGRPYKDILPPLDYNQGTEVGGQSAKTEPVEYTPQVDMQPLNREYVEQVTQPAQPVQVPQPVMQQPQYPVPQPAPSYGTPVPPQRRYEGTKIKSIGASSPATDRPAAKDNTTAAASPADLAAMMYPPEVFPQMQPQQPMMTPQYPQFGPGAHQPPPQQLYPAAQYMQPPVNQYGQPVYQQPMQPQMQMPQPQMPQPQYQQPQVNQYGQPIYPQPQYQQPQQPVPQRSAGYPVFGAPQSNNGSHIQNPNAQYQRH